jgi:hypothetical protein
MAWNGEIRRRIQEVKDRVRIEDVARALGIEMTAVGRVLRARCLVPSHEDKEPSFTIDPAKQRFRCYGCGVRGDVVDLVKLARGVAVGEALAYLDGGIVPSIRSNGNGGGVEHPGRLSTQEMLEEPEALESLARLSLHHREVFLKRPEGVEYLAGRGLADRALLVRLGAGYCDGTGRNLFPVETRRRLSALGLFNEKGNECFYKCVTFPLTDREGRIVGLYGRGIDQSRHLYLAGPHRGVFNRTPEKGTRLVLAESVLDAVAWLSMGASHATGLFGVNGLTAETEAYLVEVEPSEVVLALDRDGAGEKATERVAARLTELGIPRLSRVAYPDGVKDAMDLVAAGRGDEGRRILQAASQVGTGVMAPVGELSVRAIDEPYLRFSEGELVYRRGDLEYRITGLGPKGSGIRVQTAIVTRGLVVHTDQIRVFKDSERQRLIARASAALSVQPARVGEDLAKIVAYLAAFWENAVESTGSASRNQIEDPPPSEEARGQAMALLADPALLDRIAADIETVGYVGDRDAKILVYLVALSRRLERPLSGIIKSSTGAGKSALMDAVVSLVPPKEVFSLSRLTPGALWWFGREDLVHKLLVVDEAAGLAEALYALRTFQERRKISQAVPVKDPMTGALGTKVSEVLGPAAVIFATTLARLDREDENRALTIMLCESREHTQMIHAFQKSLYTPQGYERSDRAERVKRLHHDAQRLLAPMRVLIPFQDRLVFPDMRPETTRDARRVLGVLEVVTYLFQYQREREKRADGHTYVYATFADYRAAYELVARLVWASLDDLAPQERRLYHAIREWVDREASAAGVKPGDYHFTRRSLRENTGYSQDALKRYLRRLVEMELISIVQRKSTGSHVYRLAPAESAQRIGHLTTPDELEGKA